MEAFVRYVLIWMVAAVAGLLLALAVLVAGLSVVDTFRETNAHTRRGLANDPPAESEYLLPARVGEH